MGVIGRLDGQVNEVIIKPVGDRHKPQDEERNAPPQEERPPAPQERERDDDRAKAQPSELPVWLL